jgi:hypothetical protein
MNNLWLIHLEVLLNRYNYLSIGGDINLMSYNDLFGLYLYLSHLSDV